MARAALVALLASAALAPPALAADVPPAGYTFTLNGQSFAPALIPVEGSAEQPAHGDLIAVSSEYLLPLGTDRAQAFHRLDRDEGILWTEAGGRRQAAAVTVKWTYTADRDAAGDPKRVLVNPLAQLGPDEIRGLRCVALHIWSDEVAAALKHLDPRRACVVVTGDAVVGPGRRLAPLPAGLLYLSIRENNNVSGIADYQPLADLKDLRYLSVDAMVAPFDCRAIGGAAGLAHLAVRAPDLRSPEALAGLAGLRQLRLAGNRKLRTVAFAAGLRRLRTLAVAGTAVADLAPLAGHPTVEEIDARLTPLTALPLDRPLPALRTLDVLSTKVTDADAATFRKLNPNCRVALRWDGKLADAVAGADRVRVRTGGTCHRRVDGERTLYEERDPAKVRALVAAVTVDEPKSGFHCMCCGEPSVEFYRGDALLVTLGYHHGQSVRWVEGWPGDAALTAASAAHLAAWLAANVPEIKAAQTAGRGEAKRQADAVERFVGQFPEAVRPWLRAGGGPGPGAGDDAVGRRIAAAMPDEKVRLMAACRAFGTLGLESSSWGMTSDKERRVLAAVKGAGGAAFQAALEDIKDDRPALLGAARLFFYEDFDALLPAEKRPAWTVRLAEIALTAGCDENKPIVLRILADRADAPSAALLRDVMRGKTGTAMKRGDFEEPGLRAGAALALARRKESAVKPVAEALLGQSVGKADAAACQVALALLGDAGQLRPEHFQLQSYSIGRGAIRAVEQFGGRAGLDLLVEYGLRHPWGAVRDEAELAVGRITGQAFPERNRDAAIRAWWADRGRAFVEAKRKEAANPP